MITLADVAKVAGVNISTVSRYLSGKLNVRPCTEIRINNAIKQLNYRPNRIARALKTNHSQTIGVVTPSASNPLFAEIVDAVYEELQKHDFTLIQIPTGNEIQRELEAIQILEARQVDGLIILNSMVDKEIYKKWFDQDNNCRIPVVFINCMYEWEGQARVLADFRGGSLKAVKYLLSTGRRTIAMMSGRNDQDESEEKEKGYCEALQQAGLKLDPKLIRYGYYIYEEGYNVAKYFITNFRPDAIIAANDLMAIAAMRCALSFGLDIPNDIAIIGYGNSEASQFTYPALSTIDQGKRYSGKNAASLLLQLFEGAPPRKIFVKTSIVIRESC